jgi:hypothetical protein
MDYTNHIASVRPPLKTVDEHNEDVHRKRQERQRILLLTGVACPACGKEMEWEGMTGISLMIYPQRNIERAKCECGVSVQLERL